MKEIKKFIKLNILTKELKNVKKEDKKCFIFMAANYGNLGDIAITYAQRKFLEENLKGYKIIEVCLEDIYSYYKSIKNKIKNDDIITLIGGGNTGDLYIDFEERRRFLYKNFKNNKIISFPQSIYFSNTKSGRKELEKSKKVYNNNNLVIFARESKSYELYKKYFSSNIKLVPDIVLSLKEKINVKREGITICLRNDKEKDMTNNLTEQILDFLKSQKYNLRYADTHIGNVKINIKDREKILKEFLKKISSSKIVITDRLHGMIFCAITATPCIVLSNNNHKVLYTYKNWLKDLEYIHFIDKNADILSVKEILNDCLNSNKEYDVKNLETEFEPLRRELKSEQ